jgi:hypothetical protein
MEVIMKVAGAVLIILALATAIVPQFTDCHSQGKFISMPNGMTMEMKCFWTAMSSIALGIPLGVMGILTMLSKRREARRMLAVLGVTLGVGVILIPTVLIGVCPNAMMLCNMVLKPVLMLTGTLATLTSLIILGTQLKADEPQYDLRPTGA